MLYIAVSRLMTDRRAVTTIEYAMVGGVMIISCAALVGRIGLTAGGLFATALASFP